jgi:hypothetical protein
MDLITTSGDFQGFYGSDRGTGGTLPRPRQGSKTQDLQAACPQRGEVLVAQNNHRLARINPDQSGSTMAN